LIKISSAGLIAGKNFTDNFFDVKKEIRKLKRAINSGNRNSLTYLAFITGLFLFIVLCEIKI
jgi:hypothetical protein